MGGMTSFALVYARASSDKSLQRISVDRQIKLCTARAADMWPDAAVRVFRDDAITAADPNVYRPGFADFLTAVRAARKGELAGVVTNEQSRLTRQGTGAWDDLVVTLTKAGITKVETLRSGPVSVEPGNRLVGRLLAVVDAEEVERTKVRVQDAHHDLFNEGRPSGRAPFGYRSAKDDAGRPALERDPVAGPVVEQVFNMAIQGHAVTTIVEWLNAGPVPPRSASWKFSDGRKVTGWTSNSVRSVLTSPTVAGLRAHTDDDGVLHTVPARWESLIDVDRWQNVQRLLGRPRTVIGVNGEEYRVRTKPRPQPRKYLLSGGRRRSGIKGQPGEVYGVLRCWKCDFPLVAQTQTRPGGVRMPAYQCHPKVDPGACGGVSISPADDVEAAVVEIIQDQLALSPKLRKLLSATDDAEAARWRADRDAARGRMLDAGQLFGAGTIDRDTFKVMHEAAKTEHDAADARLTSMTTDMALPSADDVIHRWESLTLAVQRAVVDRLIDRIVVGQGYAGRPGFNEDRLSDPVWRV
jgi:DNA invertase Pin-like site-specific DNA recombinase